MSIHYISPYSTKKDIGGSINKAIEQLAVSADDWICLTDHDTCWLLPDSKAQLERILSKTDYAILGSVTNRLGGQQQLVQGMYNEYDIRKHIEIAKTMQELNGDDIIETTEILAAYCLCFRVDTWRKLGGFLPNSIQFDTIFCSTAMNKGMKCGIMTGIYLLHLYRMLSDNPQYDIKHLLP